MTVLSSQVPSSQTLEGNSKGRLSEANIVNNALKNGCTDDPNDCMEDSKCEGDKINFRDYFVPARHQDKVAPTEVLGDKVNKAKRSDIEPKSSKNMKKPIFSIGTSPDIEISLKSNIKSSKFSGNEGKAPCSRDIDKIKSISQEDKRPDLVNGSRINGSAPAYLKENGAIFRDGSSKSTEDENEAVNSDANTRTPSDNLSLSGNSERESKLSLESLRDDSDLVSKVPHQTITTSATHGRSVSPEFKVPESCPPSHATINGLQPAKQHKFQGISAAASFNGSHLNKYHHAHGASDSHAQGATVVSNFEDGEVYASTPAVAMPDSPAKLTWADQASSGEFIPKEALDLEEEYDGFSVNSEFLFGQDNHFRKVSINGGYNTGGSETGECRTGSRLATGKKPYSTVQPQQSRFPAIRKVTVQPLATTVAIQPHTQRADHTDCTATVTSKINMLASSSSVGNTVPSQHEGLISPSAGVACPSIIVGCSDTAHPPTPNVAIQAQAPSYPGNRMALGPPGQHVPPTNPTVHLNFQPGPHGQQNPLNNPTDPSFHSAQQMVVCHQIVSTATYTPPLTHLTTGQPNESDPSAPDKAKGLAPFYGGPYQTIPSSFNHCDTPISVTHSDSITLPLLSTNPVETKPQPLSLAADPIQAASTHSDNALRDAGDHTNPIAATTNSAIEQQIVHPKFQRINPMVTGPATSLSSGGEQCLSSIPKNS
ncbi:hypothetical protein F0562_017703 [Nyssa sinensis]|uniref:Uncharacterized protein n=1 Tax=Nyssa sinensis TaxID=561372 RepID=A0A5J4ZFV8_9ASTE|nr:hypothetical protein F0562_017703 [Nyssa sinensis]